VSQKSGHPIPGQVRVHVSGRDQTPPVLRTAEHMAVTDNAGGQPMTPATTRTEEGKNDGR
jgi:hypothetical protein